MTTDSVSGAELEIPPSYLRACILVLLAEEAGYGYELSDHLPYLAAAGHDKSQRYRLLRQMERDGLVVSHWDESEVGPARRVYSITRQGLEWLDLLVPSIETIRRSMTRFLRRYRDLTTDL